MADSGALRQQRRRRHLAGDHALCRPDRCAAVRGQRQITPVPGGSPEFTGPQAGLQELAEGLMAQWRQDPSNTALSKELRVTLLTLEAPPDSARAELLKLAQELS